MLFVYGFALVAAFMDLRFRKVSNRLILMGLGVGLIRRLLLEGGTGLLVGVIQIIIPVVFLYLFFLIGALGAADIKLFSLIGGFVNFKELATCVVVAFMIGAIWSIGLLLQIGVRRLLHKNQESKGKEEDKSIPFAVAIFLGLLVATL